MIERLHALSLGELESLSSAAEAGHLSPPATEAQLLAEHLGFAIPLLDLLREFPTPSSLKLFLRAIVTQRRAAMAIPRPELVWTGPEPTHSRARRTAIVLRELFESARQSVFIAGYAFDGGVDLLAPLHAVMREHAVQTRIVLDCSRHDVYEHTPPETILDKVVTKFWTKVWTHGDPKPRLFYDPRTLERTAPKYGSRWFPDYSMHAKCIVVDRRRVLVGSANFTARGQTDNLEVGIALDDPSFATALLHQWNAAMAQEMIRGVPVAADERYASALE